jgi:hypothetical protein
LQYVVDWSAIAAPVATAKSTAAIKIVFMSVPLEIESPAK